MMISHIDYILKYETPPVSGRRAIMLKLLLIGYGNAAAQIAWRGACLGQMARRPLGEGRALRNSKNKE